MKLPSMIKGWVGHASTPEQLLSRYLSTRDNAYLALLVKQFNQPLFHYLLTMSDKALAEDVMQITWLKVMKANAVNESQRHVKAWLYTIARNSLFDEMRTTNRWQSVPFDEAQHCVQVILIEQDDRLALFNQVIEQLPFYQREAFVFQQEGFSVLEIADITGDSFETVKSRLRYARQQLKKALGKNHE